MAEYRERINYTEMASDMLTIGGGFIVSGFSGRYVEESIKPGVTPASSTSDKVIAGVANNVPKLVLYYIFDKIKLRGAAAAAIGSVGYDALIRATNQGVNPANVKITLQGKDYRILNPQNISIGGNQLSPTVEAAPFWQFPREAKEQERFGAMPFSNQQPSVMDRQRHYGSMINFDNPASWRQPAYGSLPFEESGAKQERQHRYGFAGKLDERGIAVMYGMR